MPAPLTHTPHPSLRADRPCPSGPSHQPHSDHPGPYAHLHAHPFARLSAQPAQQISILSVSSQAGTDWAFEPDAAFESADEQSPESQLSPRAALSRYESTIGDNGTTVYAPSVASSTGLSLAASQLSSKDHNGRQPAPWVSLLSAVIR